MPSPLDALRRMDAPARERSMSGVALASVALAVFILLLLAAPLSSSLNARAALLVSADCEISELAAVGDECSEDDCDGFYVTATLSPGKEATAIEVSNGPPETVPRVLGVHVVPMLRRGKKASESGGGNKLGLQRLLADLSVGKSVECFYEKDDCQASPPGKCYATLSSNVGAVAMAAITTMWALFFACCGLSSAGTLLFYCLCRRR
jgi:hypothetical protein